jgi:hypothetical protein
MKGLTMRPVLAICLLLSISAVRAQDEDGPPEEFRRAYRLAEEKKFDEALVILDDVLKEGSHTRNALFSAGSIAMCAGEFKRGQKYFAALKELEPKSATVRAALVRAAQALGDLSARDAERRELFRLRESGEDPEVVQQQYYMREECTIAGRQVRGLEFFELKGDKALRYVFEISRFGGGETEYRVTLGSYTATNAIWQATQNPKPKEGERVFHLDGYFSDGSHATFGMYHPEPTYDEVRKQVAAIIERREGQ